jgi:hypothetical protein
MHERGQGLDLISSVSALAINYIQAGMLGCILWYLDFTVRGASSAMGRETVSTRRCSLYSLAR